VSLLGSDFGLHADLRDVHLGLSFSVAQPVAAPSRAENMKEASPQFNMGMRFQLSVTAPVVERVALRSGIALMHFPGRQNTSAWYVTNDACDDVSFESDFLITLFPRGGRTSVYGIVGASVDFLHYFGTKDGGLVYDHRTTNNAIVLGVGRSQRSGERRYTFEVVFHKALVYDVAQSHEFPRIDRVELSYGIVF
jgi:hypothetical protein